MRYCAVVWIGLGVLLAAVAQSDPPPKPSIVAASWQLEFDHQELQSIRLVPPGRKEPRTYWYLLYQVRNRTGADQVFVPDFVLYTDTGQLVRSGKQVPTSVFVAIQKRHNNPLLENLADITGRILQGADNAKDGVAVWSSFDAAARGFEVFVGGLSGERATVKLPSPVMVEERDKKGKVRRVAKSEMTLAKTLKLSYSLPGEAKARAAVGAKLIRKKWVMR